jgi:hypothetical protein
MSGDRLQGPVFTNSEFHITGNPAFYGPVGSHAAQITYYHGGAPLDNPYFLPAASFDPVYHIDPSTPNPNLSQPIIPMPTSTDPALKTGAYQFTGDTAIVFVVNPDGKGAMNVTNVAKGWTNHNMTLDDPALTSQSIYVNGGNLTISGRLKGVMTVAAGQTATGSKGSVVIADSVRFNDRYDASSGTLLPSTGINPGSTEYLGIMAESNVIVSRNVPTNDVEIDGSIMALGTSFIVENWYDSHYNKGTLTVLGGIIQEERGPVGTFSGSTKVSGYYKNYIYDTRLLNTQLPYFPTTGQYQVMSWQN